MIDASISDILWFIVKVILVLGIVGAVLFFILWIYSFFWVASFEKKMDNTIKDGVQQMTEISGEEMDRVVEKVEEENREERGG